MLAEERKAHQPFLSFERALGVVVLSSQVDAVAPIAVISMVVQACAYARGHSVVHLVWAHACLKGYHGIHSCLCA